MAEGERKTTSKGRQCRQHLEIESFPRCCENTGIEMDDNDRPKQARALPWKGCSGWLGKRTWIKRNNLLGGANENETRSDAELDKIFVPLETVVRRSKQGRGQRLYECLVGWTTIIPEFSPAPMAGQNRSVSRISGILPCHNGWNRHARVNQSWAFGRAVRHNTRQSSLISR